MNETGMIVLASVLAAFLASGCAYEDGGAVDQAPVASDSADSPSPVLPPAATPSSPAPPPPVVTPSTQATIPQELEEETLDEMRIGDVVWTVFWAMWEDEDGYAWLRPKYGVTPEPFGTSNMRVERCEDGYHVWPPRDAEYRPEQAGGDGMTEVIPVTQIHVESAPMTARSTCRAL